jgi:hypothetical protein
MMSCRFSKPYRPGLVMIVTPIRKMLDEARLTRRRRAGLTSGALCLVILVQRT